MLALEFQQTQFGKTQTVHNWPSKSMFTYSVIKTVNLTNQELLSMYVSIGLIAEFKLIAVCKQAWKQQK